MVQTIAITGAGGYIGSALTAHLSRFKRFVSVPIKRFTDYRAVSAQEWASYDVVVHLAAHSSVSACQQSPADAWANNVTGFEAMLRSLNERTILIYASSGSVYNRCCGEAIEDAVQFDSQSLYDLSKFTMDGLSKFSKCRWYSLRFGTVCGYSPKMREDLMINAMTRSAMSGVVRIQNRNARRAVLGIDDCVRAIQALIEHQPAIGIYNLASFNSTIGEIGLRVANSCGAAVALEGETPCYDFSMSTQRFCKATSFVFNETVESIVDSLKRGNDYASS